MPKVTLYLNDFESDRREEGGNTEIEKEVELDTVPRKGDVIWLEEGHKDFLVEAIIHDLLKQRTIVLLKSEEAETVEDLRATDPSWKVAT